MDKNTVLSIVNLHVEVEGHEVLHGINMEINEGETIAIFGPNGSGKTTLIMTIMGFSNYKITKGEILYKGKPLNGLQPYERAHLGIGIAFQRPPVIRGVKLSKLLNIISDNGELKEYYKKLDFEDMLERDVNLGFSGGESKRSEVLQLLAQKPYFVMLDEPESGVDLENIKIIGEVLAELLEKDKHFSERHRSAIIVTHTGHILKYVEADKGYTIFNGYLTCEGNPREILAEIEKNGFNGCKPCTEVKELLRTKEGCKND